MKVLVINGSPHKDGTTVRALNEIIDTLNKEGIESILMHVPYDCKSCMGCGYCHTHGKCVQDDIVNKTSELMKECDGMIVGSPVYYANMSGSLLSFLTRLFYSKNKNDFRLKPACAISASRRAGGPVVMDSINKFFSISEMPIISSTYWNEVHGSNANEVINDEEGLQIMRNIGHNMTYYLRLRNNKDIKESIPETSKRTNFIK